MGDSTILSRRDFTLKSALAVLAGATITISGCDSDSPTAPTPTPGPGPGPGGGNETGTVSANHGHTAEISAAELSAGNALSLDIRGTADHPHTVELTMNDVMAIDNGDSVSKTSSVDAAHDHTVTFN